MENNACLACVKLWFRFPALKKKKNKNQEHRGREIERKETSRSWKAYGIEKDKVSRGSSLALHGDKEMEASIKQRKRFSAGHGKFSQTNV